MKQCTFHEIDNQACDDSSENGPQNSPGAHVHVGQPVDGQSSVGLWGRSHMQCGTEAQCGIEWP